MNFHINKINRLKTVITLIIIVLASLVLYFCEDIFKIAEDKLTKIRASVSTDSGMFANKFKPASNDIVVIFINEISQYEASRSPELNLGRWPWSRRVWANVVNFLEKQEPKMIILDLNFSNYEEMGLGYYSPDMILSRTLREYNNIVLATAVKAPYKDTSNVVSAKILDNFDNPFYPTSEALNTKLKSDAMENKVSYYSHTPIPDIFTQFTTMAVTNLETDKATGTVLYSQPVYKLIKGNKAYYMPSIPLAALMKYTDSEPQDVKFKDNAIYIKNHKIPLNDNGQVLINWHGGMNSYTNIPVNSILHSMVRGTNYFEFENKNVPLDFFKDKIIIIALTQMDTETHDTPIVQDMPDAEIKATIIDNYINDSDIKTTHKRPFAKKIANYKNATLTTLFCLSIIFAIVVATNLLLAFINASLIIGIYCWMAFLLYLMPRFHILIDMAVPLYCMLVTFAITYVLKSHHEYKKRKRIKNIFGNLVSEEVLKKLINKPHKLNLKAGLQKVTIMSCNIYNNVEITDSMSAETYIDIINKAFNTIERIIFKYNGTINRFIGNSVLVYWGYPIFSRKDTESAVKAALEIEEAMKAFNEEHFVENTGIDVKIAINTGSALIGQIGSKNASDFTLLGETVDVVDRIEKVCVEFNRRIIVSEETINDMDRPPLTSFVGQVRVRNYEQKIKLYELISLEKQEF